MQCFSLQVNCTDDGSYQWQICHRNTPPEDRCSPFLRSFPIYPSFREALDVDAVMLARACGEPYSNLVGSENSMSLDAHIDRGAPQPIRTDRNMERPASRADPLSDW